MAISATYVSSTQFTVSGDLTTLFPTKIRVRVDCGGWVYSSVSSSSYGAPNTTVTLTQAVLTNPCGNVEIVPWTPDGVNIHDHSDDDSGGDDVVGTPPDHQWSGTQIRFKKPDGSWGSYVDLGPVISQIGDISDVWDAVSTSMAQGDIMVAWYGGTGYQRLAIGSYHEFLAVADSGYELEYRVPDIMITGTAGEALSQYDVVYSDTGDSGEWKKAQNDGTELEGRARGIVIESGGIGNGSTGSIMLVGLVTNVGWSWTDGAVLWLDATAGSMTETEPGSGYEKQICGVAISSTQVLFLPTGGGGGLEAVESMTAGETLSQYDVVYPDYDDSGEVKKAIRNGTEKQAEAIGMVTESGGIADTSSGSVTYFGPVTYGSWTWTPGKWLFVDDTSGQLTQDDPDTFSLGEYVKPFAWAVTTTKIIILPQLGYQVSPSIYDVGGCTPDYMPPDYIHKDADEISIVAGRYFMAGHRVGGQYQNVDDFAYYQDVSAQDLDLDANMVGGDVVSSWYSVFLMYDGSFLVLPYIRADTVTWNSPNTEITPANHADGTTQNDNFVTANDVFNGYRLVYISKDTDNGTTWTISDSVDGTPDQIMVTGDITSILSAADFMQMIPPSSEKYVYLGTVGFDGSGNLKEVTKNGWQFHFASPASIGGNMSTSFANTELGDEIPPSARGFWTNVYVGANGSASTVARAYFAHGLSGSSYVKRIRIQGTSTGYMNIAHELYLPITAISKIRNKGEIYTSGAYAAAEVFTIEPTGWEE